MHSSLLNKLLALSIAFMISIWSAFFYYSKTSQTIDSQITVKHKKIKVITRNVNKIDKSYIDSVLEDDFKISKETNEKDSNFGNKYIEEFDCIGKKTDIALLRKAFQNIKE